jgi:probable rRNA maturation factor
MITIEPPPRAAGSQATHRKSNATSPKNAPPIEKIDKTTLRRFLLRAQSAVGLTGEVHVLLSDDAALRRLNRLFRGKDKATDVLSFPASTDADMGADAMAGDLAISLDHAQRQAAAFNHSLADEVRILLLHGLLHLAGEDHETDSGQMAAREQTLRAQLRLPLGLIERVQPKPVSRSKPVITPRRRRA